MAKRKMVTVENVHCPGRTSNVDAAMKKALLKVLPKKSPGLTQKEMFAAVRPHLPESLWPSGEKSGWWTKSVQLDLEAKKVMAREKTKPLRWHLIGAERKKVAKKSPGS